MPIGYNASTMGTERKPNFKSIGEKLQSGVEIDVAEKDKLFKAALNYASGLVEKRLEVTSDLRKADKDVLVDYLTQPESVKHYLSGAILGRIVSFHAKAVKDNITGADSTAKFTELRAELCKKLSICPEIFPDDKFITLVGDLTISYLDARFNNDIQARMQSIRKILPIIVPDNPSTPSVREAPILD